METTATDIQAGMMPIGSVIAYPVNREIPPCWLKCDGSYFSYTHENLSRILPTSYTPDYRGRFLLGSSFVYSLGATGGAATHKLTINEMPAHSHSADTSFLTKHSGQTVYDIWTTRVNDLKYKWSSKTANTGGSMPHNNMPPYHAVNFLIRAC
ncbi:uncharacterized protein LOC129602063 [Paramacrobiotus metropolitanus]|uniref:uncharacterized protein LOC129602063 n=1 Tax=Paramacrobiotus metropolitanus TaxID=2943436 RepID=UPI002445AC3F|nr:uncharacterized protein LOC129602063 [Paramacrobiotus metropolitanus]